MEKEASSMGLIAGCKMDDASEDTFSTAHDYLLAEAYEHEPLRQARDPGSKAHTQDPRKPVEKRIHPVVLRHQTDLTLYIGLPPPSVRP
jgi:hypothetical protein